MSIFLYCGLAYLFRFNCGPEIVATMSQFWQLHKRIAHWQNVPCAAQGTLLCLLVLLLSHCFVGVVFSAIGKT